MATFTYTVTVEVEDDLGMPTEYYGEDYRDQADCEYDDNGNLVSCFLSPETKARIIMGSRLGCDEELGIGDYTIDYEAIR